MALTENEESILAHWSMWGSDGYPVAKGRASGLLMVNMDVVPCHVPTKQNGKHRHNGKHLLKD